MSEEIWFPYEGVEESKWKDITERLINEFPIKMETIRDIVLDSWNEIFTISNATRDFAIGETIFPKPQILGFFLEEIVTQKIYKLDSETWLPDPTGYSKDLVNTKEPKYSMEIKTSSSSKNIYGNRSYAQQGKSSKKSKDGYYLAINFEKFNVAEPLKRPEITLIRFGYLNYTDWVSQSASTGQQARIPANIESVKLLPIYEKK
jgi:restriction endonuclease